MYGHVPQLRNYEYTWPISATKHLPSMTDSWQVRERGATTMGNMFDNLGKGLNDFTKQAGKIAGNIGDTAGKNHEKMLPKGQVRSPTMRVSLPAMRAK